jgi:hypothetical protein
MPANVVCQQPQSVKACYPSTCDGPISKCCHTKNLKVRPEDTESEKCNAVLCVVIQKVYFKNILLFSNYFIVTLMLLFFFHWIKPCLLDYVWHLKTGFAQSIFIIVLAYLTRWTNDSCFIRCVFSRWKSYIFQPPKKIERKGIWTRY